MNLILIKFDYLGTVNSIKSNAISPSLIDILCKTQHAITISSTVLTFFHSIK